MELKTKLLAAGAALAALAFPAQAMAADARVTADVNIRVGPGLNYGYIDMIPAGTSITVYDCVDAYAWCDVGWGGYRGWVYGQYLLAPGYGAYPVYGPTIGVPIVQFSFVDYHDRWYRNRPWYRERHWAGRWDRREARRDRREDRREAVQERREDRRDVRRDRRENRREALQRQDRRENAGERRREVRQERTRDRRREVRQERRIEQRSSTRQQRALTRERREPQRVERRQRQQAAPRQQRRIEQRQQRRGQY